MPVRSVISNTFPVNRTSVTPPGLLRAWFRLDILTAFTCWCCAFSSLVGTCIGEAVMGGRAAGLRGLTVRTGVLTSVTPPGLLRAWFKILGGAGRVGVP